MKNFFHQIESLNQRGGRMLSIVDLIEANTLDAALAAYLWQKIDGGCSFMTAARPGGAGKSTIMANMLNFLPARSLVKVIATPDDLPLRPLPDTCYIAHEIGTGGFPSYLWGSDANSFLSLAEDDCRVASCMHADTLDELQAILQAPPTMLSDAALAAIDLLVFIYVDRANGPRHRIAAVYESKQGGHICTYRWDPEGDLYHPLYATPAPERAAATEDLVARGVRDFRETREILIGT